MYPPAGNSTAQDQGQIDQLIRKLPDAIQEGQDAIVAWIGQFAEYNDNDNLIYDKAAIASSLEQAGYRAVDKNPETVPENPKELAQFIIGRAISNLRRGMPIHPAATHLARNYKKMVSNPLRAIEQSEGEGQIR